MFWYSKYLYPHERLYYAERLARYHDCTMASFIAALGAELETIGDHDWQAQNDSEVRLAIQLENLNYYGSYLALYL